MLTSDIDVEMTYEDVEDGNSGFDAAGFYHRIVARFNRRTWKFKYAVLTREEFVYLHSLIKEKERFLFSFMNDNDEMEEISAYANPVSVVYQSKRSGLYKNLTLEIIEF